MSQASVETPAKHGRAAPFSRFERMVALRYLRSRRSDSFISIIAGFSFVGIALGVAVLIIVMSVMNGFRAELLGKILGLNGHIMVQGTPGEGLENYDALAAKVKAVPGVVRVAPIVDGEVLASGRAGSTGALVRGMRREDLMTLDVIAKSLIDNVALGSPPPLLGGATEKSPEEAERQKIAAANILQRFEGDEAVIVGARLAENLGLQMGDYVRLTAPNGAQTPFGATPRFKAYRIVGLFQMGMSEYDSRVVFMPLPEAQAYFDLDMNNAVTGLEVMIRDPEQIAAVRTPIIDAVGPAPIVIDWQQMNSSFFGALQVERNVMFLILTLIILVAALNIVSGLIMFVKDKGQDIAILRTMGATSGSVMRIFFMAGASIGVFGTLGGLILGTVFCNNIESLRQFLQNVTGATIFDPTVYFLSKLPAKMDPNEVTLVVVISLSISFLATLYPAWRAARLDPVEALRYE